MKYNFTRSSCILPFFMSLCLVFSAASAAKPDGAGHGDEKKQKQEKKHKQEKTADVKVGGYFRADQRTAATEYYGKQQAMGRCPPGLAKKNNGCMPPGQAKKWALGQPLPRTVVFYPVPQQVIVRIGVPPPGYKYVRVASDILLIAIGTQLVIDAIEDLMRL